MVVQANLSGGFTSNWSAKTSDQFRPKDWRAAAEQTNKVELFQRMPFFQAMQLVLGTKQRYFSAKLGLSEDTPGFMLRSDQIPDTMLGEANFVQGNYAQCESCLVLGEIPEACLTQENLQDLSIDRFVTGYLPLKLTMHTKNMRIGDIGRNEAKGTGFKGSDLRNILGSQAQALQEKSQEKLQSMAHSLSRQVLETRSKVLHSGGAASFPGFVLQDASQVGASESIKEETVDIKIEGYADMYDIQIATPAEMVEMAPEIWPDEASAAKHLNKVIVAMSEQMLNGFGMTRARNIREALKDTIEDDRTTLDQILKEIITRAKENLSELGVSSPIR